MVLKKGTSHTKEICQMCDTVHAQKEALGNAYILLSLGSSVHGGATRRARLGPSPHNRGGREHREGSGPSSPTQIVTGNGSSIPTIPSPLGWIQFHLFNAMADLRQEFYEIRGTL